ncbi:MAG TPA: PQQ-binding-like beta-propeller repeat protein [Actinomycetota bacterium]|nr:PQQ-binding-like beta-propeller repeat protein [Actinomycetota bacterium]
MKKLFALGLILVFLLPAPPASARDWAMDGGPDGNHTLPEALPARTHSLRWTTKISDLPSGIFPMSPLLTYKGKVLVNGAGTNSVLALDAKTGEVIWRFSPDPRRSGAFGGYPNPNQPSIVNGIYYTTANNGFLYALDANTGRKVWSFGVTGTDYNKAVGKVAICNNRVFFDVLGGIPAKGQHNVYAVDARTGRKLWSQYAGAPDWPGEAIWPDAPKDPDAADTAALARNTRRFEARFGMTCSGDRARHHGEDGVLRFLNAASGEIEEEYDVMHDGTDLGFQVDGAVNITDGRTGDLLVASLNNRLIRLLDPSKWTDPCGKKVCKLDEDEQSKVHPEWRFPYGDCRPQFDNHCGPISVARGEVLGTHTTQRADGVLGGSVFTAGFSIADWEDGTRVIYAPNHDGYLYRLGWDDPFDTRVFDKFPMAETPASLRDGAVSMREGGVSYYTSNNPDHCAGTNQEKDPGETASDVGKSNCANGPWEHRASNVSSPLVAGGVVYVAGSFEHKMLGFNWKTGAKVFEHEIKWDDKSQYPPFGDTKPSRFIDLDEVLHTTPAHDGSNLYFAAPNGVVYGFSTQENIAKPRKNLAILGSGIVPFIPKWKEAMGAFDYVWTTKGDWYNPGYTSPDSLTAKQSAPGYIDAVTPFGYKGAAKTDGWGPWAWIMLGMVVLVISIRRNLRPVHELSLDTPPPLGDRRTLLESLESWAKIRKRHGL